jgi:hypothetical protein
MKNNPTNECPHPSSIGQAGDRCLGRETGLESATLIAHKKLTSASGRFNEQPAEW